MTTFASPLYIADQDSIAVDGATTFQSYVTSRAILPSGKQNQLGAVRESYITGRAATGVSIRLTLLRDFGLGSNTSDVSLTPDGSETKLTRKFEDLREADIEYCQLRIGDLGAVETYWSLERLHTIVQVEGET